jgi:hypothetical protein
MKLYFEYVEQLSWKLQSEENKEADARVDQQISVSSI